MSGAALQSNGAESSAGRICKHLSAALVRPRVALPLLGVSLVLLGWSLLFRLPKAPVVAHARPSQAPPGSNEVLSVQSVMELEDQARSAAQCLIHSDAEIASVRAALEQSARPLGFRVEVSMNRVLTNAAGFKELMVYAAVARLENDSTHDRSAFVRALDWLRQTAALAGRVELTSLNLRSNGDGLTRAQVELNFWRIIESNESAAK
jgi:hypothetical protein